MTHVTALAPFSTRRHAVGVEFTAMGDSAEVRLFTPDEYDERVWPRRGAEVRDA